MKQQIFRLDLSKVPDSVPAPTELHPGDADYERVKLEIDKYSITPRTFESRTLIQEGLTCSRFIEEYSNSATRVLRFGIDPLSPDIQIEIARINATSHKLTEVKSSVASGSKVLATSANPRTIEIEAQREDAKSQITKHEKDNVLEAIKYITTNNSSQSLPNTVIVDVLERDINGLIKPSTHTAVIFAQNGKYLVIDPSNASFSHILAGASDDIRLCFNKKFQVYSKPQGSATGPNPDEWRDCIDIAIKLAFNIEVNLKYGMFQVVVKNDADVTKNVGEIEAETLKASVPVKEVTNQSEVYRKLPAEISWLTTRLKQSSDVIIEKKVTACLKILRKTSDDLMKKLEEADVYELLPETRQTIGNFYNKIGSIVQYNDFTIECQRFGGWIDRTSGNTESATLLGWAQSAIDHLP
ncbi:MAG: hypothetical protein V4485_00635 [Pseudomonadota bacterium]